MKRKETWIILVLILILIPVCLVFGKLVKQYADEENINISMPDFGKDKNAVINVVISGDTYKEECKSIINCLIPNGSDFKTWEKFKIIHDWIISYASYDHEAWKKKDEAAMEAASDPEIVLRTGWAICGGYAALYQDLCKEAGLECYFINGVADLFKIKDTRHCWNAIKLEDKIYHVDVCWDDGEARGTSYEWFLQGSNHVTNSPRTWDGEYQFSDDSYNISRSGLSPYKFTTKQG